MLFLKCFYSLFLFKTKKLYPDLAASLENILSQEISAGKCLGSTLRSSFILQYAKSRRLDLTVKISTSIVWGGKSDNRRVKTDISIRVQGSGGGGWKRQFSLGSRLKGPQMRDGNKNASTFTLGGGTKNFSPRTQNCLGCPGHGTTNSKPPCKNLNFSS